MSNLSNNQKFMPNQKGFSRILSVFVLIIIIGAIGYFVAIKKLVQEPTVQTQEDEKATPSAYIEQKTVVQPKVTEGENATQPKIVINEESSEDVFKEQPGIIKSITVSGNDQWLFVVDLLSHNPDFLPGSSPFFINQNPKIRNLTVIKDTKSFICGAGPDKNDTTPDIAQNTSVFLSNIEKREYKTVYFDIQGSNVTAMYQQCLP